MARQPHEVLAELYRDLERFAPAKQATEMALLAEKLAELQRDGRTDESSTVEVIWQRVAATFAKDPSQPLAGSEDQSD